MSTYAPRKPASASSREMPMPVWVRSFVPKLKCGVCGEHGGDPDSIDFLHTVGLNYVSCSPFRVPIARLAAAQSALKHAN